MPDAAMLFRTSPDYGDWQVAPEYGDFGNLQYDAFGDGVPSIPNDVSRRDLQIMSVLGWQPTSESPSQVNYSFSPLDDPSANYGSSGPDSTAASGN
jgi:hypothetical protein